MKRQGYGGSVNWLGTLEGPLVLGFDGNHWNPSTSLEPPAGPFKENAWYLEETFYSAKPPHRLRDAFLNYLGQHPKAYQEALARRPSGPLTVSYVRKGSAKTPIEDRFDYIFVSDELAVEDCQYEYAAPIAAGSDHGTVTAKLVLHSSTP